MASTCQADTQLVVGLDGDDPTRPMYPAGIDYIVRDGMRSVVPWVNHLSEEYAGAAPYVGHIGDDNVPQTLGWDAQMIMALEETPFAFANDLYPRPPGSLCCHVFMREYIRKRIGYFGPPQIRHMYVDVAWMAWGVKTGITYRHDVIIEHAHFTKGQAAYDESYQRSQGLIPVDLGNWHEYCQSGQLNADIAKIQPGNPGFTRDELNDFNRNLNIPQYWGQPVV